MCRGPQAGAVGRAVQGGRIAPLNRWRGPSRASPSSARPVPSSAISPRAESDSPCSGAGAMTQLRTLLQVAFPQFEAIFSLFMKTPLAFLPSFPAPQDPLGAPKAKVLRVPDTAGWGDAAPPLASGDNTCYPSAETFTDLAGKAASP